MDALQQCLEEAGFVCKAEVDAEADEYRLVVEEHGVIDVKRLFESPALHRAKNAVAPVSKWGQRAHLPHRQEGHSSG